MELYLDEKMNLTERERNFAMYVISNGVSALKFSQMDSADGHYDNIWLSMVMRERSFGHAQGQRRAAREIAGSSLSELFGGMGNDTIKALETLAERKGVHTYCPIIVEEYYEELVKQQERRIAP